MKTNFGTCSLAPIDSQELVGKTITEVDSQLTNVLLIAFTDGTEIAIEPLHDQIGLDSYQIHRME